MDEAIEAEILGREALELIIVSNFVGWNHPEGPNWNQLAVILDGLDSVSQSIFLQVVLWFDFDHIFFIRVSILCLFRLLLFSFRLAVQQYGLRVSGEG